MRETEPSEREQGGESDSREPIQRPRQVSEFSEKEIQGLLARSGTYQFVYEAFGMAGLEQFYDLERANPGRKQEELLSYFEKRAINTQTNFFRESSIETVAEALSPKIEKRSKGAPVAILEIGSSSGEETWSLAADMLDSGHEHFRITAVDINPEALETARQGVYRLSSPVNQLLRDDKLTSAHFEKGYFEETGETWTRKRLNVLLSQAAERRRAGLPIPDEWYYTIEAPLIRASEKLREHAVFQEHDIRKDPVEGVYDVAMVNNVLAHYPPESRAAILRNALASLKAGGFLVMEPNYSPMRGTAGGQEYYDWRMQFAPEFNLKEIDEKAKPGQSKSGRYGYHYFEYRP